MPRVASCCLCWLLCCVVSVGFCDVLSGGCDARPTVASLLIAQVSADDKGQLRQYEGSITREPDDDDDDQGWCRV